MVRAITEQGKKLAFLLATSPHLDTLDGSYDKAAIDLIANGVAPVVHGRWKLLMVNGLAMGVNCSECHTTWDANSSYCPNCGAKMDLQGE